ncbi:autoinducer 2 ABC transporter substrate-binding protein [Halalkalibacter kiskunsagensis]|uniref:Autoinducer 2 ABC transporter substrate-binding protein n=1 Tax=Halalkalibacter kiskunsagensis TaxID=1548599 RepID=A0ABV6KDV4_9BACI
MRKKIPLIFILFFVTACNFNQSSGEVIYVNAVKEQQREKIKKEEAREDMYTIALVPKISGTPYYNAVFEGAKEAARDLGINLIFTGASTTSFEEQEKIVENLISQKVDAIAISASDPFKLLPVLNKARKKNIKVLTWDSDTDPTGRDFFVNMVDSQTLGFHLMDSLASTLNEKGDFAIITSSISSPNTNEWIKAMKIRQKKYYPNMNLVQIVQSDDNYENAYHESKKLIKHYPNLSAIVGVSPVAPPAAAEAVMEVDTHDIYVLGTALPNTMRSYLENEVAQNITLWSPQKLGYLTVSLAKNWLDGDSPLDQQYVPNVGNIRVLDNVVIMGEPIVFTKENIDQYDF